MTIDQVIKQFQNFYPDAKSDKIREAFEFAQTKHGDQRRKTGEPFIQHPLNTAFLVAKVGMDTPTIIAALLHDSIEDTKTTSEEITNKFGKTEAKLVDGVTKTRKIPHHNKHLQEYEIENLRRLFLSTAADARVVVIRLADRLHNMRTLSGHPPERRRQIAKETLQIYSPIASRLCIGEFKGELEDLAFPYVYPDAYKWLKNHVTGKYRIRKRYTEKKIKEINKLLKSQNIELIDIHGRAKHLYSLYKKLLQHNMNLEKIYDLVATRIIVPSEQDCYKALGILHSKWPPLHSRVKDYIASPKLNGYQSLHTTVFFQEDHMGEIQIRTPKMHHSSEFGIAAHWLYEQGLPSTDDTNPQNNNFQKLLKWFSSQEGPSIEWLEQIKNAPSKNPSTFLDSLTNDYLKDRILVLGNDNHAHDLPEDATIIDLAYDLGIRYGNHCVGARINGIFKPARTKLQNGDNVHIITDKDSNPSEKWLKISQTTKAKNAINDYLRHTIRIPLIKKGKDILRKELITSKHLSLNSLPEHLFSNVLQRLHLESIDDIYLAIARGDITVQRVLRFLDTDPMYEDTLSQTSTKEIIIQSPKYKQIKNLEFGSCCKSSPGDAIVGTLENDNRIIIHNPKCPLVNQTPATLHIALSWNTTHNDADFEQYEIEIKASGRIGLIADLARIIANNNVGILDIHTAHIKESLIKQTFIVESDNKDNILNILREIRKLRETLEAKLIETES